MSVRLVDVAKSYQAKSGPLHAVAGANFDVGPGEFVSIVGPSGCGKSTLLKIVAGLISPSSGYVEVGAQRVSSPVTEVGVVFQRDLLLEWRTVLRNVLLQAEIRRHPKAKAERRARELLEIVGLAGFENAMPRELSGGMRQRVAICRALLHDPPLLLMDEPFGALDAITRDQLNLDLQAICMKTGSTVIFVTHSISEAVFLSDRVLLMSPRPATIAGAIDIELPRGRQLGIREELAFGGYVGEIRRIFEEMGVLRAE